MGIQEQPDTREIRSWQPVTAVANFNMGAVIHISFFKWERYKIDNPQFIFINLSLKLNTAPFLYLLILIFLRECCIFNAARSLKIRV